jgi:hypothetical protein
VPGGDDRVGSRLRSTPTLAQVSVGQARSSTVRSARHTRMQQRSRSNHQDHSTPAIVGTVNQQAEVAVQHPTWLQHPAIRIPAELPHWPCPLGWRVDGHQATRPVRRRPGGALHPPSGHHPQPHPGGGGVLLDVGRRQHPLIGKCGAEEGRGHDGHSLGWQPSRFLTDRAEAERAFQLAEQLGSVNAAATQLDTTWPSLRKAFTRHGLGMPTRTPRPSASGPSPRPASAAASRPPRAWTRCSWPSIPAPSPPAHGRRPSCSSGSAARSNTPPSALRWWSSCTAKATPASPPPGPGRSSDAQSAATGWPTSVYRRTSE